LPLPRATSDSAASSRGPASEAGLNSPAANTNKRMDKGTPNFADRLAAVGTDLSPPETSAAARCTAGSGSQIGSAAANDRQSQAEPQNSTAGTMQEQATGEPLAQGSSVLGASSSSVPPPPSSAELDRCNTIDNASGALISFAPSTQASPEPLPSPGPACPAPRTAARGEDVDSSVNDPPWLRALNAQPKKDVDASVNDPPWLRALGRGR
jgi:hypothetical protein